MNRSLLKKEFLNEIARQRSEKRSDEPKIRVAFHRLALLLNLKLILGTAEQQGKKSEDDSLIGDITLLANEFLSEDKCENDKDLILESLPAWEISNPRDVAYAMARYDYLIRDYLCGDNAQIKTIRDQLKLTVERFEGLLLDEYLTLIFGIYSVVRKQRVFNISAGKVAEGLKIAPGSIACFFSGRALPMDKFRDKFADGGWTKKQFLSLIKDYGFVTDTKEIRRYPFLKIDDDKYLVLDLLFVVELLTSGLYWSILDSLPARPSKDRERFAELWGRAFELYTVDLLRHYYPEASFALSPLKPDVQYVSDGDNGQIDALLDYGNEVILFEMKASLLSLKAKCGRDWDYLENELTVKFVENEKGAPKALRQLARSATAAAKGRLFNGPIPDHIYPVLVVDEKAMECMGMNCYLNQTFRGLLGSDVTEKVCPLTVISIDELEELLPYVEQAHVSWQEVLRSRFKGDDIAITSIHQALYNIGRDKSIPLTRNQFLLRRYEEMFSRIKDLFTI